MTAPLLPLLTSPASSDLVHLNAVQYPSCTPRNFDEALAGAGLSPLVAAGIEVLQLNLGRLCNQTCSHCHVDAGPTRTEIMDRETAELCMQVLAQSSIPTVDLTGGAPELCPSYEYIVEEARRIGRHVIDRCNLTVLSLPRFEHIPEFFAKHRVEVVSSLPDYRELATDKQRGAGVYEKSIEGLRRLNSLGYGQPDSGLELVIVTNPVEPVLPGKQAGLELEWKGALERDHGVLFNRLFTITNMPIRRYLEHLRATAQLEPYMHLLVRSFNAAAAHGVMCRTTLSVDWQGYLYDCDFNQMLELPVGGSAPRHLKDFDLHRLSTRQVVTNAHCFGCTAGFGSSCGGTTA